MEKQYRILVVEDSATQAELLKYILEMKNYRVETANNGLEGLEKFRENPPDLIISDIVMPMMDGYQFCREVRHSAKHSDIPVILLTSLSEPKDVIKGLKSGADNFIRKPYNADHLLLRIRDILTTWEVRKKISKQDGLNFYMDGETHVIHAEKQQILDLLISTFESAIEQNRELIVAERELKQQNEILQQKTTQLEITENNFRTLLMHLHDAIIVLDAVHEPLYLNPAAEKLFGEDQNNILKQLISQNLELDEPQEVLLTIGENQTVIVEANFSRTFWEGNPAYLLTLHDITVHKKAEAALEEAAQLKSTFLANISHELRTPLNGIMGMTQLTLETNLDQQQRESLEIVRSSSEYLLMIINDILDFSRAESGMLELNSSPFCLRDAVADTVSTIAVRARQKGIQLAYYIHPDIPDNLIGDPGRFRQILLNLVGNAIKFTDEGEVNIEIEPKWQRDGKIALHLSVSDTGIGIPEDRQKIIFRAFAQADSSLHRKYGGTGLGLAISSQLIEMMNGKIWVESPSLHQRSEQKGGPGTTMHVTVQFEIADSPPAADVTVFPESLRDLPVLILEQNPVNRKFLHDLLQGWGLKPTTTENAKEALEKIHKANQSPQPFRLVLLNRQVYDEDGFEIAARIKSSCHPAPSIIISLPGIGERGDAARCREAGIDGYTNLPVKPSALLDMIVSVLAMEPYSSADNPVVTRPTSREQKNAQEKVCHQNSEHSRGSLQVLLAEDNVVNQKLATRILQKMGHQVTLAANGKEAVETWQKGEFDIIFMDIQMPEMDGLQATEMIRQIEKKYGGYIPIVALTAHVMDEELDNCLKTGMDGYVSKPIKIKDLSQAIEKVLSNKTKKMAHSSG